MSPSQQKNPGVTNHLNHINLQEMRHTVSPRFSPGGLIAHKKFLPGGLIEGGAKSRGGLIYFRLLYHGGLIEIIYFSSHKKITKYPIISS